MMSQSQLRYCGSGATTGIASEACLGNTLTTSSRGNAKLKENEARFGMCMRLTGATSLGQPEFGGALLITNQWLTTSSKCHGRGYTKICHNKDVHHKSLLAIQLVYSTCKLTTEPLSIYVRMACGRIILKVIYALFCVPSKHHPRSWRRAWIRRRHGGSKVYLVAARSKCQPGGPDFVLNFQS